MKFTLLALGLLLLINPVQSQNKEVRNAKRYFKSNKFYSAALSASKALNYNELSKGQLKKSQSILFQVKDKSFELMELEIENYQRLSAIFENGETVRRRKLIINRYKDLIVLQERIETIPKSNTVSVSKKIPNLEFTKRDYSEQLTLAKKLHDESIQQAAEMHYQKGLKLSKNGSILDLYSAYSEFSKVLNYVSPFKDVHELRLEIGRKIGEDKLIEGDKSASLGTLKDLEYAIKTYKEGLRYYPDYEVLKLALTKVTDKLAEAYYSEAKAYLDNKTMSITYTELPDPKGIQMGIKTSTLGGLLVNELLGGDDAKKTTTPEPKAPKQTTIKKASIDNHYAAQKHFLKLFAIDKNYKDAQELYKTALSTSLYDQRNGKRYYTIKIGNLIWMNQNLDFEVSNSFYYKYKDANGKIKTNKSKGRYYSAESIKNNKNTVCPKGWRLPNVSDFNNIITFINKDSAGKFKSNLSGYGKDNSEDIDKVGAFKLDREGISIGLWSSNSVKYLYVGNKYSSLTKGITSDFYTTVATAVNSYYNCRCVKFYTPSK